MTIEGLTGRAGVYRLITLLVWAAAVAVMSVVAGGDWQQLYGSTPQAATSPSPTVKANTPTQANNTSIAHKQAVAQLFGRVVVEEKAAPKAVRELPTTRLNLRLIGTFTHDNHQQASALIASGNQPSQRFFGGENVGDAELVKITKSAVILRRNGRDEALLFPRISPEHAKQQLTAQDVSVTTDTNHNQIQVAQQITDSSHEMENHQPTATFVSRDDLIERIKRLQERK